MIPQLFPSPSSQANRRRLLVFLCVFLVSCAVSLSYTFMRPPEYRASTRLEITPASASPRNEVTLVSESESTKQFLTEVQVLTSRPVIEKAAARLSNTGQDLSPLGSNPVAGMQSALEVTPVAKTNVVELAATGGSPALLAPVLNMIVATYRDEIADAYRSSSQESVAQTADEVRKLKANVDAKRREVEAFRNRYNIVSLEREENEVLARVRGRSVALNNANERVATAEGKLRSLTESAAAGKTAVRARDNPTLANLEQRLSQAREELRDLERRFTPDYLAMDPTARAIRVRISELERQLDAAREASRQAAIVEAQEGLAEAREAAQRIQQQMAADRQAVSGFAARFNEYKSMQDDLAQLETVYRDAAQRQTKLLASERARTPSVTVLEAATTPREPWRPLYWRDAGLSILGSIILALFAVWLVELFNRTEPQPTVVVAQPFAPNVLIRQRAEIPALQAASQPALESTEPVLLPRQESLPRELREAEIAALLQAADDESRLVMLLLLSGLTLEEAVGLHWRDVDLAQRVVQVAGEPPREVAVNEPLTSLLTRLAGQPDSQLLRAGEGAPIGREHLATQILCAAHDAGIERATEVTPESLRHTYIAFLVRQRVRFADLLRIVGRLSPAALEEYGALSPEGPRATLESIERVFPATRDPHLIT
jgi:uncharacterized protein involved in exopolysaccharide biosynthesis